MHFVLIPTLIDLRSDEVVRTDFLMNRISKSINAPDAIIFFLNLGHKNEDRKNDLLFTPSKGHLNTKRLIFIEPYENLGVNFAWNMGIHLAKEKNADLTILNDDIQIKPDFMDRIAKALEDKELKNNPVICPQTTHNRRFYDLLQVNNLDSVFTKMSKREGWAFTIRKEVIESLEYIPGELITFCGDDWIYDQTIKYGNWIKDERNIIFHTVGKTLKDHPEIRATLKNEKRIYQKIKEGLFVDGSNNNGAI
jgi:hypothetical protein